ncbi:MAG: endonuclease/exonuclease/phosphatase family protein [archaeon]|jgi:deoxyribonuclease-1-like protein
MKKRTVLEVIAILVFASFFYVYNTGLIDPINGGDETDIPVPSEDGESIRIAAFNIQIFGRSKRDNPMVMDVLADTVREFDIVLIEEIRDSSETTAPIFLEEINLREGPKYDFIRSSRVGRTSSKEAYAYFYNTETVEYIPGSDFLYNDTGDVFEREPYVASFYAGEFDFTLVGIHTKPDDAYYEIGNLTVVYDHIQGLGEEQDIILLGDFNADGSYFDEDSLSNPLRSAEYYWVIENDFDTMTKTDWTYDRIILTNYTYNSEYILSSSDVYYFDTIYGLNQTFTESVSDHYPVYAEFNTTIPDDD